MIEGWNQDPTNSRTLDSLLDLYIKCYNDSIAAHKDKMHFGLHICRGERGGAVLPLDRHLSLRYRCRVGVKFGVVSVSLVPASTSLPSLPP